MSYQCQFCNKAYSIKQSYERHLLTNSHKKRTDANEKLYNCACGRSYLYRQSLYNHKTVCKKFKIDGEKDQDKVEENAKIEAMQKQIDELKAT